MSSRPGFAHGNVAGRTSIAVCVGRGAGEESALKQERNSVPSVGGEEGIGSRRAG